VNGIDAFVVRLGLYSPGLLGLPSTRATRLRTLTSDVSKPLTIVALEPFTPLLVLLLSSTDIHWGASARSDSIRGGGGPLLVIAGAALRINQEEFLGPSNGSDRGGQVGVRCSVFAKQVHLLEDLPLYSSF